MLSGAVYLGVLPIGHTTALRSVAFVLAAAAAIALWQAPSRRVIPVIAAIGAWLLAAGLSLATTRDMQASVQGIGNEIIRSAVVFLVFYTLTWRTGACRLWVGATATGLAFISVLAIVSHLAHGEWRYHYVPRLGEFTTSAITVLPLLIGYLALSADRAGIRIAMSALVGLILIGGYFTGSRVFWLTIVCGVLIAVALYGAAVGRVGKRSVLLVGAVAVSSLLLATVVAVQRDRSVIHFEDRLPIYAAVLQKLPNNPITGTGYGQETDKRWYEEALPGTSIYHPHNIVVGFLDQMGIFGLVALVLIFAGPAWVFAQGLRCGSPPARAVALCGLTMIACVFLRNNFDYFFVKHNLWLFFAHLGIYTGLLDRTDGGSSFASARLSARMQ